MDKEEFIRDICKVIPMSKSEAKRRLDLIIQQAEQEMLKRVNKELDKMRQSIKGEFTNEETKLLIELFGKAEYPHYYQERMYGYNQGLEDTKKIINNLLK